MIAIKDTKVWAIDRNSVKHYVADSPELGKELFAREISDFLRFSDKKVPIVLFPGLGKAMREEKEEESAMKKQIIQMTT